MPDTGCRTGESRSCTSPGKHTRGDPVSRGARAGQEVKRAEELTRAPHSVPCGGMGEEKMSLLPLAAWGMKAVELGSRTGNWGKWPCLSWALELRRNGPAPHLGNTVELPHPLGCESKGTSPQLGAYSIELASQCCPRDLALVIRMRESWQTNQDTTQVQNLD